MLSLREIIATFKINGRFTFCGTLLALCILLLSSIVSYRYLKENNKGPDMFHILESEQFDYINELCTEGKISRFSDDEVFPIVFDNFLFRL